MAQSQFDKIKVRNEKTGQEKFFPRKFAENSAYMKAQGFVIIANTEKPASPVPMEIEAEEAEPAVIESAKRGRKPFKK